MFGEHECFPASNHSYVPAPGCQCVVGEHNLRGARVFELDENAKDIYTSTRTVFAKDCGIDMDAARQPLAEPLPLPEGR